MGIELLYYKQEPYIRVRDGIIIEVCDKFLDLTGFNRYELLNRSTFTVWNELFRIDIILNFENVIDIEKKEVLFTKQLEVRFVTTKKHENVSSGEIFYTIIEKENSRLNNKLAFVDKLISDNKIGIGIFTAPDLMLIKANETYLKYLPKPFNLKELAYGKCIKQIIPDFVDSRGEKAWMSIIDTNQSIYITEKQGLMLGNDERYWDNTIAPISENGEVKYIISMLDDVTERVLSREHIRIKNEQLQAIIDNMHDGLTVLNRDGKFITTNNAVKKIMKNKTDIGITVDKVGESIKLGQRYYDEYGKELSIKDIPSYRVLQGEKIEQQRILIKSGSNEIYLDFNAIPIFDDFGDLKYGIVISHDITEIIKKEKEIELQQNLRLKAEEDKLQALEKALKMKDEFISLISHEFKTPLNVIYAALQLIDHVYINEVPERVQKLLVNIKQNTFRQLRLVNNLLDITRLNSGPFKLSIRNIDVVNLVKLITQSVKLYSDQKNIKLDFLCKLESKHIAVDDEKLERIILNLLSNAIKFTNNGGIITVCLRESHKRDEIIIEVSDTGIGIPKNKQDIIFERFGQVESDLSRQAEGTGIGLSLVKHLVDILGGKIELESELGNGSTFRIFLPANECIKNEEYEACLDEDSRLVNAMRVEFSDIYV